MKSPLVIVLVYLLSVQGDPGLSRDSSSENTRHFVRSSNFAKKSEFDEEKDQVLDSRRCNCHVHNATERIKGSEFDIGNNALKKHSCGFDVATNLIDGTTLGYFNVDLGDNPPPIFQIQFSSEDYSLIEGSNVAVYLDSTNNKPFAEFGILSYGQPHCNSIILANFILLKATGVHTVYIAFQVDDPKKQTLDLDWFSFSRDLKSSTCSSSNKYRNSDTIDDHDAIEQRFYNEPIVPNLKAVEPLQCDNYFKRIEAESFNKTNFAVKKTVCGETVASNLTNGTYLAYDQVDFGNVGIDVITLNFLSENETQVSTIIEIYLDKIDGFRLAKFQLNFIGIKCQFYLFKFNSWPTWGVHDMFIKFTNLQPSAPMNLDWIDLARDLRKPECPEKILILPVRGENVFPIFDVPSTK